MLKQISLLLAITIVLETLVIYMEWTLVPIENLPNSYYKLRERLDGRSDSSPRIQRVTNRRLVPCISTTIAVGLCLLWSAFCLAVYLSFSPPSPPVPYCVCVCVWQKIHGSQAQSADSTAARLASSYHSL
jgi:hypothetical protein